MKKVYVLDTNIPLLDPDCLSKFEDNDIVFSTITIKELDKMKKRIDEVGKNARIFNRKLKDLNTDTNLFIGVPLEGGGTIRIETNYKDILSEIETIFYEIDNDDRILSIAVGLHRDYISNRERILSLLKNVRTKEERESLQKDLDNLKPVILVTRDNNMIIRAKYFGLPAENYTSEQLASVNDLYSGWRIVKAPPELINNYYIQSMKNEGENTPFQSDDWDFSNLELHPNEYIVLVDENNWNNTEEEMEELYESKDAPILKYDSETNSLNFLIKRKPLLSKYNIFPINIHQVMLVDMLFDQRIVQKSIVGLAGSGKTLFALLVSIIMVNELNQYDEIIITRPPIPMEYDMGALPGNEEEKMDPYLRGFKGNLEFISSRKYKNKDSKNKNLDTTSKKQDCSFSMYNIKTESMAFMRGKTTHKQILIIDESQNATLRAMKTALTRIGQDSIVILLGDISQIDHHLLDATNNGLTFAVELMKDETISGHVTLEKGERSELSEKIAQKWDRLI